MSGLLVGSRTASFSLTVKWISALFTSWSFWVHCPSYISFSSAPLQSRAQAETGCSHPGEKTFLPSSGQHESWLPGHDLPPGFISKILLELFSLHTALVSFFMIKLSKYERNFMAPKTGVIFSLAYYRRSLRSCTHLTSERPRFLEGPSFISYRLRSDSCICHFRGA